MLSHVSWQEVGHQLDELWDMEFFLDVAEHANSTVDLTREKGVAIMGLIWMIGIDR
jgi:hypothetical protein